MAYFLELLLLHFIATVFMTGLLWLVQLVHYPLFLKVGASAFAEYERLHQQKITPIVAPLMLFELVSSLILVYSATEIIYLWINAFLVSLIWASTFFVQMPLHFKLSKGYNTEKIKSLVRGNWFRTVAWTIRVFLLGWMIWEKLVE